MISRLLSPSEKVPNCCERERESVCMISDSAASLVRELSGSVLVYNPAEMVQEINMNTTAGKYAKTLKSLYGLLNRTQQCVCRSKYRTLTSCRSTSNIGTSIERSAIARAFTLFGSMSSHSESIRVGVHLT